EYNPDIDIIFLTAYEDFVRDAFEVYALDYLIKPINKNRLYKTLERAKRLHKDTGKIISLPCKGEIRYVNTKDVLFVEAQGKKAKVVTKEKEMFVDANLAYILKESDGWLFQSNRSFLVNLKHVKSIKRLNRSSFEIYFDFTDKTALLSNRLYEDFRRKIKEIYN
ncbi:MAG: LytTR family DNA-binding domain-containing protein, partial [Thermosediminibacteraceae bacterium]|nr:LytTR family DNA-binding domain-containing protein [Thermosediminibacteraceae bacterium]